MKNDDLIKEIMKESLYTKEELKSMNRGSLIKIKKQLKQTKERKNADNHQFLQEEAHRMGKIQKGALETFLETIRRYYEGVDLPFSISKELLFSVSSEILFCVNGLLLMRKMIWIEKTEKDFQSQRAKTAELLDYVKWCYGNSKNYKQEFLDTVKSYPNLIRLWEEEVGIDLGVGLKEMMDIFDLPRKGQSLK